MTLCQPSRRSDSADVKRAQAVNRVQPPPPPELARASDVNTAIHNDKTRIVREHDAKRDEQIRNETAGDRQLIFFCGPPGTGKLTAATTAAKAFGDGAVIVWGGRASPHNDVPFENLGVALPLGTSANFDQAAVDACVRLLNQERACVIVILELPTRARRAAVIEAILKTTSKPDSVVMWPFECERDDVVYYAAVGQRRQGLSVLPDDIILERFDAFEPVTAVEATAVGGRLARGAFGPPPASVSAELEHANDALLQAFLFGRGDVVEQFGIDVLRQAHLPTRLPLGRLFDAQLNMSGLPDCIVSTRGDGDVVVEFKSTMASPKGDRFHDLLMGWAWQALVYLHLLRLTVAYVVVKPFKTTSPYCSPDWLVYRLDASVLPRNWVKLMCQQSLGMARVGRAEYILDKLQRDALFLSSFTEADDDDGIARAFRSPAAKNVRLLRAMIGATLRERARRAGLRVPVTLDDGERFLLRSFLYVTRGVRLVRDAGLYLSRDGSLAAHSIGAQAQYWATMDERELTPVQVRRASDDEWATVGFMVPSPLAQTAAQAGIDMTRFERYAKSSALGAIKYETIKVFGDDFDALARSAPDIKIGEVQISAKAAADAAAAEQKKKKKKKKQQQQPPQKKPKQANKKPEAPAPRRGDRKRKPTSAAALSAEQAAMFPDIVEEDDSASE